MANRNTRITLAIMIALSVFGCNRQGAPTATLTAESERPADSRVSTSNAAARTKPEGSARRSRLPQDAAPPISGEADVFTPPFPHRTNPFALPNTESAQAAAKQRETVKQADERLLGFIDVDGRKALLHIEGQVWAAKPGDRRNGIEVVELTPAEVTLRRDGATWRLSLMQQNQSG